jgi:hypothetical protein
LHYTTLLYPENACFFTLHDMKTKFIGHIDNALLNTFVLKVRYHDNSVLRIRLKICLLPAILKIPSAIFFEFFDYCTRQSTGKNLKHLKFTFLTNIYLKCNNYNKAFCDWLTKFREKTGVWGFSPRKLFHFWSSRTAMLAFSKAISQTM